MSDINQRIKDLSDFFMGMQVETIEGNTYIYVIVKLPPKWKLDTNTTLNKYQVQIVPDDAVPGKYFFIAEMEVGFDTVFDAIDFNIEKMKILAERSQLLKEKIYELQEIFQNDEISIESLRTLEFKYKQPRKKLPLPKQETINEPKNEEVEQIKTEEETDNYE